jgi:xanthine dehydrogenase FAD-binding subunit
MFQIKHYEKAESIEHAIKLLETDKESRPIAGGTDVLIRLRDGKAGYDRLVDIHGLDELKQVKLDVDGTLVIGSGVTFSRAMNSTLIREKIPILATAAGTVGGPQVRNVATIGGNICNGVTSADSASPLMVLNAVLQLEGPGGIRRLPIADFYKGPGKVDIGQQEILAAFLIPSREYEDFAGHYHKYAMRNAMDIATIGCAALCRVEENRIQELRLAFGVAAPIPIRCPGAEEAASGKPVSKKLIHEIANLVEKDVNPRTSWRASKEFRLQIISELTNRVITEAIIKAGGKIE